MICYVLTVFFKLLIGKIEKKWYCGLEIRFIAARTKVKVKNLFI